MVADTSFSGRQILAEVHWRLNALMSGGGISAYQPVFGPNPVDRYGWRDGKDGGLLFAQDTPPSGQFAQQWKLRMMAQGAALKGVAYSKLRRLLAYNQSFTCTDVHIGGASSLYKAMNRKSTPRRRGPAQILTAKFQSQTFMVRATVCGTRWRRRMRKIWNWIPCKPE